MCKICDWDIKYLEKLANTYRDPAHCNLVIPTG